MQSNSSSQKNINVPQWILEGQPIKHPFNCIICGPTCCGKTYLLKKIIEHKDDVIMDFPPNILYCYKSWQDAFTELKSDFINIEFLQGLPSKEELSERANTLIILDDLNNECVNSEHIMNLFTVGTHHQNMSVMFLTQNLFIKGKFSRDLSLNANYMILFRNPRDQLQIRTLASQMFPGKDRNFLIEAFNDATEVPRGYLFIDLKQTTIKKNRIQTGILPYQKRI